MSESPMELIRKLDQAAAALLELARHVRAAAPEVADAELRQEMLESAEGLEQRAQEMAEAIAKLRVKIN
ncbi:MAG TPA: hypothetical protein VMD25_01455 [Acidobacteriaceae bacterium]|nr:hypothetical protein [Acidobacteriaceae bacterium]